MIRFRSLSVAAFVLPILAVGIVSCRSHKQMGLTDDTDGMVSTLRMNDGHTKSQLISGFYNLEAGAWRWTAPKFSVNLQPPAQSATKGAKLVLELTVPEPVIQKLNVITLSAKIGDTPLPQQTFNKPGDYVYSQDVPSSALQANSVRVDFWLDKSMPPTENDRRELGIIVRQVGLEPK